MKVTTQATSKPIKLILMASYLGMIGSATMLIFQAPFELNPTQILWAKCILPASIILWAIGRVSKWWFNE